METTLYGVLVAGGGPNAFRAPMHPAASFALNRGRLTHPAGSCSCATSSTAHHRPDVSNVSAFHHLTGH
jgi:hypothetical protein